MDFEVRTSESSGLEVRTSNSVNICRDSYAGQ